MPKITPELSKITAGEFELARKTLVDQLRLSAAESGITHEDIAGKTGFKRQNVTRVLGGKYPPNLDTFLKIADAVGMKVELTK